MLEPSGASYHAKLEPDGSLFSATTKRKCFGLPKGRVDPIPARSSNTRTGISSDGDLVVYDAWNDVTWSSGTSRPAGRGDVAFVVQDDGDAAITRAVRRLFG